MGWDGMAWGWYGHGMGAGSVARPEVHFQEEETTTTFCFNLLDAANDIVVAFVAAVAGDVATAR